MSTTNNQSIRQINTSALRGTREAHQPDVVQLHPLLHLEKNMTQTARIDTALNFSMLEVVGDGYNKIALLNGKEWETCLWGYGSSRTLTRDVPAGASVINESSNNKFRVEIKVRPCLRACVEKVFFGTLLECADFAESFVWEIKEHAGHRWYLVREDINCKSWVAVLGVGDVATLGLNEDGEFYIKRNISPRIGESYEFTACRYDSGDSKHAVRTFEEAAAIAITLPSFVSVLSASS